jgi:hypothetical protein
LFAVSTGHDAAAALTPKCWRKSSDRQSHSKERLYGIEPSR